jgi:anionic cell wall polymer biosynthesis LytR-Cps2A-Psr (LCP) family protein
MLNSKKSISSFTKKIAGFLQLIPTFHWGIKFILMLMFSIIIAIILLFLNILIQFNKIAPENSIPQFEYNGWLDKGETNILLIGTDKMQTGEEFIDFLMLIQFDKKRNEMLALNINPKFSPYFLSETNHIIFRNAFVVDQSINDLKGVELLIDRVEFFAGMRVDGYVLLSKQGFDEIFNSWPNLLIHSPSMVEDPDLDFMIQRGENMINFSDFIDFVSAEVNGENDRQSRQLSAFNSFLTESNLFYFVFNVNSTIQNINKNIRSNLTGEDFFEIAQFVRLNRNLTTKYGYIRSHPGYVLQTWYGEIWRPIYENIDQDIREVFTNQDAKIEQAKIDVLNGSGRSGLAASRSRWLENRGLRVVVTGNFPTQLETNTLFVEDIDEYKWTIFEIANTLRGNLEIVNERFPDRVVGDMVLILGENEVKN